MARVSSIVTNFQAGELSPRLEGRIDLQKYNAAAQTLQNMLVFPQGGVTRRPGSYYAGTSKNGGKVRLINFEFSDEQAYVLEFGVNYIRFYKDGVILESGGSPVEVVTTYSATDIFEINHVQSADVLFLAHKDHPPAKLTRTTETSFTLTDIDFVDGPYLDENITTTTLYASAQTGTVTITASASLFTSDDVGRYIRFRELLETHHDEWAASTQYANGETVRYNGHVYLQDTGSTETSGNTPPVHLSGTETYGNIDWAYQHDDTGYVKITAFTSATEVTAVVQTDDQGVATLPDHVIGSGDATTRWSLGAFGGDQGFPRAVAFYEERLYFAGTDGQPQTIFGSVTADFENHTPGVEDDSAINVTIASDQVNVIKHMIPGRFLQIMTTSAEFTLSGGTGTTAVTPTNVNVLRETTFGSGDVRPLRAGASTIMIQKGGEKVKEVTFSLDTDGLVGRDLTVLGEHLARGGLTDMVWQQEPELVLWFVRGDGTLIGLSYDPANNTIGWHQHPLGGTGVVESITAIPSGTEDQVYLSVKRTIDSSTVRHIVYLKPLSFDTVEDAFYVDSGITHNGPTSTASSTLAFPGILANSTSLTVADGSAFPSSGILKINDEIITYDTSGANNFPGTGGTLVRGAFGTVAAAHSTGDTVTDVTYEFTNTAITGLDHLEGETVQILADGSTHADKTVSGGSITLDRSATKVHVGYSYDSLVKTLRMEAGAEDGIAQGKTKRIHGVTARFVETVGAELGPDINNLDRLPFRDSSMAMDTAVPLFNGDKEIFFSSGYENDAQIVIRQNQPLPMTVIAIMRRSNTFDA